MGESTDGILGKVSLFLQDRIFWVQWPFWNHEVFEPSNQVHIQRMAERKDGRNLGCG